MQLNNNKEYKIDELITKFREKYPIDSKLIFGATTIIVTDTKFIFALENPEYWKINGITDISFSGVGGKIEDGESPFKTLTREVEEEVGLTLAHLIFPQINQTLHIDENGNENYTIIDDNNPKPFSIMEFESLGAPGNIKVQNSKWYLVLFIYFSKLKEDISVEINQNEKLPAILSIDKDHIGKALNTIILKKYVKENGFSLNFRKNFNLNEFPDTYKIFPKFSAKLLQCTGISHQKILKLFEQNEN